MRDYRYALPRMHALQERRTALVHQKDRKLMRAVLDRIRAEGPLIARDFETPKGPKQGWWDWKPAKRALEQLFMHGDLMIAGRDGFQKVYDLPERVLPAGRRYAPPDHRRVRRLSARHGTARARLRDSEGESRICAAARPIRTRAAGAPRRRRQRRQARSDREGGHRLLRAHRAARRAAPRTTARVRLLSPFDNAVIQRDRNVALHEFDYQIECYVPAPKRRFGYFCLPILYRDRFVGRVDCKAQRRSAASICCICTSSAISPIATVSSPNSRRPRASSPHSTTATSVNLVKVSPGDWDA